MVRENPEAPERRRDHGADVGGPGTLDAAGDRARRQDLRDRELTEREERLRLRERELGADLPDRSHLDALTERQREVLGLIARGLSNQEIAERLFVTVNTVKTTIRGTYRKIGATSRTQAVLWYLRGETDPD